MATLVIRSASTAVAAIAKRQERVVLTLEGEQTVDAGGDPGPALPLEVVEARAHQHVDLQLTHASSLGTS